MAALHTYISFTYIYFGYQNYEFHPNMTRNPRISSSVPAHRKFTFVARKVILVVGYKLEIVYFEWCTN